MNRPPETAEVTTTPATPRAPGAARIGVAPASDARVVARVVVNPARHWRRTKWLTAALLALWFGATFGIGFFARDLEHLHFFGWPLSYYMGAQGSLLIFLLIIGVYALAMRRFDREAATGSEDPGVPR